MNFDAYMIPAQEGFLKTDVREENLDLLKKRRALLVCTTDKLSTFGGINVKKYVKAYGFKDAVRVKLFANNECSVNDPDLFDYIGPVITENENNSSKIIEYIVLACDKWSAKTNRMVVCTLDTNYFYKDKYARSHPIIIINTNRVRTTLDGIFKGKESLRDINKRYNMQSKLVNRLSKKYLVKDTSTLTLYHISSAQLKTLTPRITWKPMEEENFGIPRISAAPTVDECFKAIGTKPDQCPIKYYVYKLLINPEHRIAKPDRKLVPDVDETHEYWVLDPIDVVCIGYVNVLYNYKNERFDYDVHIQESKQMVVK